MGILVKADILVMRRVFMVTTEGPGLSKTRRSFGNRMLYRAQCSSGTFTFMWLANFCSVLPYDFYLGSL